MKYKRIPFVGKTPPGEVHQLEGLPSEDRAMSKIARMKAPVSTLPRGVPGFMVWLRRSHPRVHGKVLARMSDQLAGLGLSPPTNVPEVAAAAANPGIGQQILSTVKELVQVGLPLYQQDKIFKLQLKRAEAGLAPLDTAALADASAVRVGVDGATRNTGLMIGGALALGLLGYALIRGRR
jgi:hypothetical protein